MPANTPRFGLTYPLEASDPPTGGSAIQTLASQLDGLLAWNTYDVTSNTNIAPGDCVFVNASGGAVTIDLLSPDLGSRYKVVKTDSSANIVTVTNPSGVIQGPGLGAGAISQTLDLQGQNMEVHEDGTNGHILGGNVDSGWIAFTSLYVNSWADNADSPAYRLIGNTVQFRGFIGGGTSGTTAFTMPVGYRPLTNRNFATSSNGGLGSIAVNSAGVTAVTAITGAVPVSLDNVKYTVD